jgi:hypothetical protein
MTRRFLWAWLVVSFVAGPLAFLTGAQGQTSGSASAATPRTPDGRPDLSGMCGGGDGGRPVNEDERGNVTDIFPSRRCGPTQVECGDYTNQSVDQEFTGRMDRSRPLYRPEHWDKVIYLDMNTNREDPIFKCQPQGIPRQGPPAKIVQTATEVLFFYNGGEDYRIIPIDGRKHSPVRARDVTYFGHAVGHWDGDTLVVESRNFTDRTAVGGATHSAELRMVERFTRVDPEMIDYEIRIDDPATFTKPWTFRMTITSQPGYQMFEYGCHEGNIAMRNALTAERAYERAAEEAKAKGLPPPERVFERVNGADRAR